MATNSCQIKQWPYLIHDTDGCSQNATETTYKIKHQVCNILYMTWESLQLHKDNFNNFAMHHIPLSLTFTSVTIYSLWTIILYLTTLLLLLLLLFLGSLMLQFATPLFKIYPIYNLLRCSDVFHIPCRFFTILLFTPMTYPQSK